MIIEPWVCSKRVSGVEAALARGLKVLRLRFCQAMKTNIDAKDEIIVILTILGAEYWHICSKLCG